MAASEKFTMGVEEEYQIIDPVTRDLQQRAMQILPEAVRTLGDNVMNELFLSQIETATPICESLSQVRAEVSRMRRVVAAAAASAGNRIASASTHPFAQWAEQTVAPQERYNKLNQTFRQVTSELLIFGCHVHVGIADREAAIQVLNRARIWLTPLMALTASSPFWQGRDTGYSSFRTPIWTRLPTSGPPPSFDSRADFDGLVAALMAANIIEDGTKIYWDIRPSAKFETLEFRVTDACQTIDETVMVAGLVRGLARTCHDRAQRGEPYPRARGSLMRVAHWRAARDGLDGELIDLNTGLPVPAPELVARFLAFVRPGLEASGDWAEVSALVEQTLNRGNGANRQRAAYERAGNLEDVVDMLVSETMQGIGD